MMSIFLLALIVIVIVTLSGIGASLTARQSRPIGGSPAGEHHPAHPWFGVAVGGAVVLFLGFLLLASLWSYRSVESQQASRTSGPNGTFQIAVPESSTSVALVDSKVDRAVTSPDEVPDWIRTSLQVLEDGAVPDVVLVQQSELYGTEAEAIDDATTRAIRQLQERMQADHVSLAGWMPSRSEFEQHSRQRQPFIEVSTLKVGIHSEPIYRAYIQFRDSAQVREPFLEALDRYTVDRNVSGLGIGVLLVTLGLGFVSSLLRVLIATPERRGGPAITAAVLGIAVVVLFFG